MTEYIERGAALAQSITVKHYDGVLGGVCDHEYVRTKDINAIPAADVEPVVQEKCDACRMEAGIGGHMRIVEYKGSFSIECESPDSWYSNSESDEIFYCPICGRKLNTDLKEVRK